MSDERRTEYALGQAGSALIFLPIYTDRATAQRALELDAPTFPSLQLMSREVTSWRPASPETKDETETP